eukprot:1450948-Amphidinium_carterae.1
MLYVRSPHLSLRSETGGLLRRKPKTEMQPRLTISMKPSFNAPHFEYHRCSMSSWHTILAQLRSKTDQKRNAPSLLSCFRLQYHSTHRQPRLAMGNRAGFLPTSTAPQSAVTRGELQHLCSTQQSCKTKNARTHTKHAMMQVRAWIRDRTDIGMKQTPQTP